MAFKKGDEVVQIHSAPIQGTVSGFALDQETGDVQVLVQWTDGDGVVHQRHFSQSEVAAVNS